MEPDPREDGIVTLDERRALLERIAASKALSRSPRLRDLLTDIGEHSLSGRADQLSEQAIGVRVFGRSEGYHSADDNIVRASVRQLRLKLKEYFETAGEHEHLVLEIPKGGYQAVFVPHPAASEPESAPTPDAGWRRRHWVSAALIAAALLALVVWLVSIRYSAQPDPTNFFSTLFAQNSEPVHFVLTDSALVITGRLAGRYPTLDEYTRGQYRQEPIAGLGRAESEFLAARQITSLADVLILSRLLRDNAPAIKRVEIRYTRHMQTRDFKSGNFIITGSPISNPWTSLFDSSLNFKFERNPVRIRNLKPLAGEAGMFANTASGEDYARVAVSRNLSGNGFVLLIAGIEAEGTEGAGEFLFRRDAMPKIRNALHLGTQEPIPPCEFVLEIKTLQRASQSAEIIAARRH